VLPIAISSLVYGDGPIKDRTSKAIEGGWINVLSIVISLSVCGDAAIMYKVLFAFALAAL